jgi:hypothetical protein
VNAHDSSNVTEAAHANRGASDTTAMQQAATSLISLAGVDDESTVAVLREIAELLDRCILVRRAITRRLSDDEQLYKNMLRILLAPTPQQAEPLIELLSELTQQARTDVYSRERQQRPCPASHLQIQTKPHLNMSQPEAPKSSEQSVVAPASLGESKGQRAP